MQSTFELRDLCRARVGQPISFSVYNGIDRAARGLYSSFVRSLSFPPSVVNRSPAEVRLTPVPGPDGQGYLGAAIRAHQLHDGFVRVWHVLVRPSSAQASPSRMLLPTLPPPTRDWCPTPTTSSHWSHHIQILWSWWKRGRTMRRCCLCTRVLRRPAARWP